MFKETDARDTLAPTNCHEADETQVRTLGSDERTERSRLRFVVDSSFLGLASGVHLITRGRGHEINTPPCMLHSSLDTTLSLFITCTNTRRGAGRVRHAAAAVSSFAASFTESTDSTAHRFGTPWTSAFALFDWS